MVGGWDRSRRRRKPNWTIVGQRAATADPVEGYGRLRFDRAAVHLASTLRSTAPEIVWALRVVQLLLAALLVVVSVNVAILVYARTVTRIGEIAVRSALGASRRRILAQLFMEALALSAFSAATGLLLSQLALRWLQSMVAAVEYVPFWITFEFVNRHDWLRLRARGSRSADSGCPARSEDDRAAVADVCSGRWAAAPACTWVPPGGR